MLLRLDVALIVVASAPAYMLTHWAPKGRLEPGKRADINLIDFYRLRLFAPEVVDDLRTGGKRLVQRAHGYEATLVGGIPVFEHDEPAGPRPGRLARRGR